MVVQQRIESILQTALQPVHLQVENESRNHNVPPDSESHFKVVIASPLFAGKPQVQRHQQIYQLLREELAGPVHALALHTFSPDEWREANQITDSPECLGGKAREGR